MDNITKTEFLKYVNNLNDWVTTFNRKLEQLESNNNMIDNFDVEILINKIDYLQHQLNLLQYKITVIEKSLIFNKTNTTERKGLFSRLFNKQN